MKEKHGGKIRKEEVLIWFKIEVENEAKGTRTNK